MEQAVSTTQVEDDDDFQFPPFFPVVVLCPKENQPLHCIKNIYMYVLFSSFITRRLIYAYIVCHLKLGDYYYLLSYSLTTPEK